MIRNGSLPRQARDTQKDSELNASSPFAQLEGAADHLWAGRCALELEPVANALPTVCGDDGQAPVRGSAIIR